MTTPTIAMTRPDGPDGAPVLVLGPSLGTSTILWELAAPSLRQRFRVVAWDLPGHGAAPAATEPFTIGDLAVAVAAGLDELGIAGPVVYAGVSVGGGVGLELALRHPDRVTALAPVCSAARFGDPDAWRARAAQVRSSGTASLVVQSAQRWFAPGSLERQPVLTGRLLHALRDADDESYALVCEALAAFDARERLGEIAQPVLAVFGEEDPVTPGSSAEEIAAGVQHGGTTGIPDASHLAPAEQPEAVVAALVAFAEEATA